MKLAAPHTGNVRIIIDSCSDFPYEMLKNLDVGILNFEYILDGKAYSDDFFQSMSAKDFYETLRKGVSASTSQSPPADVKAYFESAAQEGTPTIYLGFPAALSGQTSTAEFIAEEIRRDYPDFELYVIDSYLPSISAMLLIVEAVKLRDRGFTALELKKWAEEARYFVHGYFTLEDFERLAKGGRIPPAAAAISSKLDVKPDLSYDLVGGLTLNGVSRGRKKSLKNLAKKINQLADVASNPSIIIGNADAQKDAEYLGQLIKKEHENVNIIHSSIGPVIGTHVGAGMIGACFWGKDRREKASIADKIADRVVASRKS